MATSTKNLIFHSNVFCYWNVNFKLNRRWDELTTNFRSDKILSCWEDGVFFTNAITLYISGFFVLFHFYFGSPMLNLSIYHTKFSDRFRISNLGPHTLSCPIIWLQCTARDKFRCEYFERKCYLQNSSDIIDFSIRNSFHSTGLLAKKYFVFSLWFG